MILFHARQFIYSYDSDENEKWLGEHMFVCVLGPYLLNISESFVFKNKAEKLP